MRRHIFIYIISLLLLPQTLLAQRIAFLGDSNTWLGSDDCTDSHGWTYWFAKNYKPTSVRSYARSGATWTNTSNTCANTQENIGKLGDNNVIYNQVLRINAAKSRKPDIIFISAGTNDMWFLDKRPQALSLTVDQAWAKTDNEVLALKPSNVTSLAMAVRYNVLLLRKANPKAKIILLTPMQTVEVDDNRIEQAGNIIEQCGKKLGCHVIRLDKKSKVVSQQEKSCKVYTSDGTHTSLKGAKANGILISNALKTILGK